MINKPLLDFIPYLPWGGRRWTSDGGVKDWVEKFTDIVAIEEG